MNVGNVQALSVFLQLPVYLLEGLLKVDVVVAAGDKADVDVRVRAPESSREGTDHLDPQVIPADYAVDAVEKLFSERDHIGVNLLIFSTELEDFLFKQLEVELLMLISCFFRFL